jgi:hypothetical protein
MLRAQFNRNCVAPILLDCQTAGHKYIAVPAPFMGGGLQKTAMFIKLLKAKRETANGEIQVNPECVKRAGFVRSIPQKICHAAIFSMHQVCTYTDSCSISGLIITKSTP